jgi:hypothetical protein
MDRKKGDICSVITSTRPEYQKQVGGGTPKSTPKYLAGSA